MDEPKQKTGIIYCRVSSKEQVENTSLESQERYCFEYAKRSGVEVIADPFIDKGESAKTADRTQFQKAITFCSSKKNKVDFFIVYKIDRFARNQDDHVATRALLKRFGTELRSATEPISESSLGRAMEGMISVFAEFDNNVRTERTKTGMLECLSHGIWPWRAPIGYYRPISKGNITPEPNIAPYIRLAFEEYAKRKMSYEALSQFLFERGFRTASNKKPFPQLMEKMLKNRLYCGVMDAWDNEYKGDFEPIISKELFNQCQAGSKGKSRFENRRVNNPDFPLRGCKCSKCLGSLTGSYSRGNGGRYPYYHHHKQGCPESKSIPKEGFEQIFLEYLAEISPSIKYEKLFKQIVADIWRSNFQKFDETNGEVRRQIEGLESQRQKIFDLHRVGKYNDDEFLEQKNMINQKLMEKTRFLQDNRIEEFDMDEALTYCFNFVRDSAKTWANLKPEFKPRFQNQIFESKPQFDGKKFGTAQLSPIYAINKEYGGKKSKMVALARVELAFYA